MADKTRKRSLRQRIADWPPLTHAVGGLLGWYLRFVRVTSRWDENGKEAVTAALAEHGAVIFVFWHERSFATPYIYDTRLTPIRGLNAASRPGRVAQSMLQQFGYHSTLMPKGRRGLEAVRLVMKGLKDGISIGIAVDGPRGPARHAKPYPLQWARATGKPIFCFAFAARRHVTWPSWDKMILPLPFTRVTAVWQPWEGEIPHRPDDTQLEALIQSLNAGLDAVTEDADRRIEDHRQEAS